MHSKGSTLEHRVREENDTPNHPAWLLDANAQVARPIVDISVAGNRNLLFCWWLRLIWLCHALRDLLLFLFNLVKLVYQFNFLLVHFYEFV